MARLYCDNFSNAPDSTGCKGHLLLLFKAWSWDVFVSVDKGERAWIESIKYFLTIQFRKSLIWDATAGIPAARKGVMQWQRNENTKFHENTNFCENSLLVNKGCLLCACCVISVLWFSLLILLCKCYRIWLKVANAVHPGNKQTMLCQCTSFCDYQVLDTW